MAGSLADTVTGSCVRVGEEYERDGVPVEEIWSALPQMVEILARSAAG
jgi:hypothetical protein